MKQMKFFLIVLMTLLMGVSVTSCLKGENGSSVDAVVYGTVVNNLTNVTLLGDDGVSYKLVNPELLLPKGKVSYPERVVVSLKFAEGSVAGSKEITASIVQAYSIFIRPLCLKPDTIKENIPLAELSGVVPLGVPENILKPIPAYCNVMFKPYLRYNATGNLGVELVPVTADGNVLTLKLQQTSGDKDGMYVPNSGLYVSFTLPSVGMINKVLSDMTEEGKDAPVLTPNNGKIKIKLIGTGRNDQKLELEPTKEFKINNY